MENIAAVPCVPRSGGVRIGFWLTGKLGCAWVGGSVHGWWVGGSDVVMRVGRILNAVLNYLGRGDW